MKLQANTTFKNSMANCCKNNIVICDPIIGCCDQLFIDIPPTFLGPEIRLRIKKGSGIASSYLVDVEDGIVEVPLDLLPPAWMNPYAGPYTLEYVDPTTNEVISFVAQGESASAVQFDMVYGTTDNNICTLDIFG